MGRYYSGDIEGKFMFAVQSSDAAERFGAYEADRGYVNYVVPEDSLEEVEEEIKNIESLPGIALIDKMFEELNGYRDKDLTVRGISEQDMKDWADLRLGRQIRDYIKETGDSCYFQAEL